MTPVTFMACVDFRAHEWMLWRAKDADSDAVGRRGVSSGTWLWHLEPIDEGHTRLLTRMRDHYDWTSPYVLFQLAVDAFDFPFMRKALLGIKARTVIPRCRCLTDYVLLTPTWLVVTGLPPWRSPSIPRRGRRYSWRTWTGAN